jgi:hypothetical protein
LSLTVLRIPSVILKIQLRSIIDGELLVFETRNYNNETNAFNGYSNGERQLVGHLDCQQERIFIF